MPTYGYQCNECGHKFDVFQSINDEPIKECEKCGKDVRKLFNSTGIIFKGSGFYVNDYKAKETGKGENSCKSSGCGGCSMNE